VTGDEVVTGPLEVVLLVLAALCLAGGIRSLVYWLGRSLDSDRLSDHILFALHVTARVGLWLAFAGGFVAIALLDEPERFRWFGMVPIVLGAVQLGTGVALARRGGAS
jgi:hypothetical protein